METWKESYERYISLEQGEQAQASHTFPLAKPPLCVFFIMYIIGLKDSSESHIQSLCLLLALLALLALAIVASTNYANTTDRHRITYTDHS